jgi:outer membrane beta-barrel protein
VSARAQDDASVFGDIGSIQNEEIFVIQKKFFPKQGRHEITAGILGGIPLDTFSVSIVGGMAYAYHFHQSWAWEVGHVLFGRNFATNSTRALEQNNKRPELIQPAVLLSSAVLWSPVYGKIAFNQNTIYHWDTYFILGGGMSISEESRAPAGVIGLGVRFFLNRWLSTKLEFRDYMYMEKQYVFSNSNANTKATVEGGVFTNTFVMTLGWSLYFPKFKFNPLE